MNPSGFYPLIRCMAMSIGSVLEENVVWTYQGLPRLKQSFRTRLYRYLTTTVQRRDDCVTLELCPTSIVSYTSTVLIFPSMYALKGTSDKNTWLSTLILVDVKKSGPRVSA